MKGKTKPMAVYELLAVGAGEENQRMLSRQFSVALGAYQQQNWDEAERILLALKKLFPHDSPTDLFLERISEFCAEPPPEGWQGEYIAKDK